MGEVLAADFKAKKYLGNLSKPKPVQTPLEDGLSIIAQAMADLTPNAVTLVALQGCEDGRFYSAGIDGLAWPGMDVQSPYMSPEKDPA